MEKVKITIKGNIWYLTKIDWTHFFLSNNPDKQGEPYHVAQIKNEPEYKDVEKWLSGEMNIDGKIY